MTDKHQSFRSLIWESFSEIKGPWLWPIGIIVTLILRHISPNRTIPFDWAVLAFILLAILTIAAIKAAYTSFSRTPQQLPKILVVRSFNKAPDPLRFLCLLDPSDLFSHGILVSFYYDDGDFEVLTGFGTVESIQEDKRIQVRIINTLPGHDEIMEKLMKNDASTLRKTKVKPNIPLDYFGMYNNAIHNGVE